MTFDDFWILFGKRLRIGCRWRHHHDICLLQKRLSNRARSHTENCECLANHKKVGARQNSHLVPDLSRLWLDKAPRVGESMISDVSVHSHGPLGSWSWGPAIGPHQSIEIMGTRGIGLTIRSDKARHMG